MTYRILVTGSREWEFANTMHQALLAEIYRAKSKGHDSVVLVHGACPRGADFQADTIWTAYMWAKQTGIDLYAAETHRGRDFRSFKDRNQFMVDLGADVCLAFAKEWGSGTGQTARMARRAGINTRDYGVSTE